MTARSSPADEAGASGAVGDGAEIARPKPRKPWLTAKRRGPVLSAECAQRQGQITSLAFAWLGGRDAAIAFLNAPDDALGGRPLDLATADWDGYFRVEHALRSRSL